MTDQPPTLYVVRLKPGSEYDYRYFTDRADANEFCQDHYGEEGDGDWESQIIEMVPKGGAVWLVNNDMMRPEPVDLEASDVLNGWGTYYTKEAAAWKALEARLIDEVELDEANIRSYEQGMDAAIECMENSREKKAAFDSNYRAYLSTLSASPSSPGSRGSSSCTDRGSDT